MSLSSSTVESSSSVTAAIQRFRPLRDWEFRNAEVEPYFEIGQACEYGVSIRSEDADELQNRLMNNVAYWQRFINSSDPANLQGAQAYFWAAFQPDTSYLAAMDDAKETSMEFYEARLIDRFIARECAKPCAEPCKQIIGHY